MPDAQAPASPAHRPLHERDILDPNALGQLTRGNVRMRDQIVAVFESMMDKTLAELAQALEAGDAARLAGLGHKAKSSAASLGAAGLSRRCQALESAMKQTPPNLAQAGQLVAEITELYPLVRDRLRALSDQGA